MLAFLAFASVNAILLFSGSPGACTAGGGPISVDAVHAVTFEQKWDAFAATLDGGSPSRVILSESEISSRADTYLRDKTDHSFRDIRVCIHDGFGEVSGTVRLKGVELPVRIRGRLDFSGDHPVPKISGIQVGKMPSFLTGFAAAFFEDAIEDGLRDDIHLSHPLASTLAEGDATISGRP